MDFCERLKRLRTQSGLTQAELSKNIGVSVMTIRNWESGSKQPSMSAIISLSDVFNISSDILLGISSSSISLSMPVSRSEDRLLRCYRKLDPYGRKAVDSICSIEAGRVSSERDKLRAPDRYIPRFTTPSAAGYSFQLDGDDFDMMLVDSSVPHGADFAVRIQGSSMEPYIMDGDTVFVKRRSDIQDGDVGIFSVNGAMYCKVFYKDRGGNIHLVSTNPKMKESNVFIGSDSGESITCFGIVILQERIPYKEYVDA